MRRARPSRNQLVVGACALAVVTWVLDVALHTGGIVRVGLTVAFLCLAPGISLLATLGIRNLRALFTGALITSLSMAELLSMAFMFLHAYSAEAVVSVLVAVTLIPLVVPEARRLLGRARPEQAEPAR